MLEPLALLDNEKPHKQEIAMSKVLISEALNLVRCPECFSEPALVEFGPSLYRDRAALEKWHKERWTNNMRLLQIHPVDITDDAVTVEGVVISDRLKFWKLTTLSVDARFKFSGEKIVEARYGLRT